MSYGHLKELRKNCPTAHIYFYLRLLCRIQALLETLSVIGVGSVIAAVWSQFSTESFKL